MSNQPNKAAAKLKLLTDGAQHTREAKVCLLVADATDVLVYIAELEGKVSKHLSDKPEDILRHALLLVIANANVYPKGLAHRVLGTDMSNVIDRAVEAVLATGLIERDEQ